MITVRSILYYVDDCTVYQTETHQNEVVSASGRALKRPD